VQTRLFINHEELLKEARESWDHFVTDELMYVVEMTPTDAKRKHRKRKAKFDFGVYLDLTFKLLRDRYCSVIIEFVACSQDPVTPVSESHLGHA